jgi:hypothetical protein
MTPADHIEADEVKRKPQRAWFFWLFAGLMWIACVFIVFSPLDKGGTAKPAGPVERVSFILFIGSIASAATTAAWQRHTGVYSKKTSKRFVIGMAVAFTLGIAGIAISENALAPKSGAPGQTSPSHSSDAFHWLILFLTITMLYRIIRPSLKHWLKTEVQPSGAEPMIRDDHKE